MGSLPFSCFLPGVSEGVRGENFPLTPKHSLPSNRYKMEPGFHVLEQADCFRGDALEPGAGGI